ncbi:GGDEF domain-containing protein, partial [Enterococcus faecium]|uniref:GGDEF domain-containing protein n=1 Tax=Enterococcus faecium TaxID=1352 RepID=UPI0034E9706A
MLFADLEAKLQRLVNRDALTNLQNRRGFFINGDKISKELKSHKHALSVVMIDIDHFKKVNDQYGHSTGDMAIKWIAQHI